MHFNFATVAAAAGTLSTSTMRLHGCPIEQNYSIASLPTALPAPTTPLYYITAAVGTQNYTCSAAGNYTAAGAVAELFDISCLVGSPLFSTVQDYLLHMWKEAPAEKLNYHSLVSTLAPLETSGVVLGQHYFVPNPTTGQGLSPVWDFIPGLKKPEAYVLAARTGGAPAPTNETDIDWLSLKSVSGSLATEVYRTDTREGKPPASAQLRSVRVCVPAKGPRETDLLLLYPQGQIPGFTQHIFPQESRSYLNLVATIGLCLFLFLVGLEIDAGVIKRNARLSATVALAGMIIPFAIGAGIAVPIYNRFIHESVEFTHFMLFTGVAYSITAFPVLCRILTELKLLDTTVGIVVLSAGVGNDIIGWVLLALSVALVNAGNASAALYILLVSIGWTIFILFPVRWAMKWLARETGSIESGPSVFFMTATIIVLFGSSFFTDYIGVHAIFGAFLAGLVVPREGGLAIALTEKLEDMVSIIFLPLYFTLSGLSTDLTLLNDPLTWAFTIAIICTAFIGKFGGCILAARYLAGFNWREASTIGSLMSCKGLVELIVLNVGLSAGILSPRVFSMFVLEALVLTFITTPLVTWLYPPRYRVRTSATGANFSNIADGEAGGRKSQPRSRDGKYYKTRFTVVLDKFEHLSGMMALTQLVNPSVLVSPWSEEQHARQPSSISIKSFTQKASQVIVEAIRVMELSDRVSAVMKSSAAEVILRSDPLLSAFRMFGALNDIRIVPSLAVVKQAELAYSIVEHAKNNDSDMIMIPWLPPVHDPYESVVKQAGPPTPGIKSPTTPNPFDMLFKPGAPSHHEASASVRHSQFVRAIFSQATTDVALYVDQSAFDATVNSAQHLFVPFFGGPDDRATLELVMQLCENPRVTATIVRFHRRDADEPGAIMSPKFSQEANALTVASSNPEYPDTYYGQATTESRLQSDTADNILWSKYSQSPRRNRRRSSLAPNDASSSKTESSKSSFEARVEFKEIGSHTPLNAAIHEAMEFAPIQPHEEEEDEDEEDERDHDTVDKIGNAVPGLWNKKRPRHNKGRLVIMTGRSRRLAVQDHQRELKDVMDGYGQLGPEVRKALGDVACAFVAAGVGSGIVVLQAASGASFE
ncbi:hypothetical protein MD484_g5864, partial [Candolleomyces efflorescens]